MGQSAADAVSLHAMKAHHANAAAVTNAGRLLILVRLVHPGCFGAVDMVCGFRGGAVVPTEAKRGLASKGCVKVYSGHNKLGGRSHVRLAPHCACGDVHLTGTRTRCAAVAVRRCTPRNDAFACCVLLPPRRFQK